MNDREMYSLRDVNLLLLILLAAAALWLFLSRAPQGMIAVVEQDGKKVYSMDLRTVTDREARTFWNSDGMEYTVLFYPDGAAMRDSKCFEKDCVRRGKITRAGESIVCVPCRVSIRLEGDQSGRPDAETF